MFPTVLRAPHRAIQALRAVRTNFRHPQAMAARKSVVAHLNSDLARLGNLLFGERYRHRAVLIVGLDMLGIDRVRQRKRAVERSISPLDPVIASFLGLLFELTLTAEGQRPVLHPHIDVLELYIRDVGLD